MIPSRSIDEGFAPPILWMLSSILLCSILLCFRNERAAVFIGQLCCVSIWRLQGDRANTSTNRFKVVGQLKVEMTRCQFVYIRSRGTHVSGGQCERQAEFAKDRFCGVHRGQRQAFRASIAGDGPGQCGEAATNSADSEHAGNDFPHLHSDEEAREWVNEALRRTSPMTNWRRGCIVCGRGTADGEMITITMADLIALKASMTDTLATHLGHVDPSAFKYSGALAPISGLPIDRNGVLTADEMVIGSPAIGRGCQGYKRCVRARYRTSHWVTDYGLASR